ncbi:MULTISPECIES: metallophosphoesterase family protein [Roseobacteraceae]|jgi:3',5'-cyclic AMP phosphodiesterase CpdA|uniref:3',5'-cyclic adenosine monophosphate phosphodiesterase CpdA n=1 Tax=Pseudosulfitobacter pseudonitzschiae TaxID=1402135 RepID=A0A221K279_9RHOB|nr:MULTISPECIES: metallophosphoesterase family protein [Roseobacteraceae]ASM72937.1 3',5'-cyclic adenosine monophosphate phosphodiesterase CpdA [Pseudosulfitobacter pseudonitzschiae]
MKRIIHLSDLHFGRDRPELMAPLLERINGLDADLVAISGDLTQRARARQFQQARTFIDAIDGPTLVVPGNHDTPLYNFFERVVWPFRRYRSWINRDLQPVVHTPQASVVGINSVNPLGIQRGWFSPKDIRRVRRGFRDAAEGAMRIVVVHHPLEHLPGEDKKLMRGARAAIKALGEAGTDIVLSGHLHSWRAETFAHIEVHRGVIQIHAGTGLSNRVRGEPNDFNLLHLDGDLVHVERFAAVESTRSFDHHQKVSFTRDVDGWTQCTPITQQK